MNQLYVYLKPLFLTIVFEGTAAYILGIRSIREQLLILLVNVMTNPLLVYFSLLLMYHIGIEKGTILTYLILEPIVVMTEYHMYHSFMKNRNAFILSLVLNLISVTGGILCQRII